MKGSPAAEKGMKTNGIWEQTYIEIANESSTIANTK